MNQVKLIELSCEGPTSECPAKRFEGPNAWDKAAKQLARWGETAPEDRGYDKCDFTVTFSDLETYKGRFDLVYGGLNDGGETLPQQMRSYIMFHAGERKPEWMEKEEYQKRLNPETMKEAKRFLENYEIPIF